MNDTELRIEAMRLAISALPAPSVLHGASDLPAAAVLAQQIYDFLRGGHKPSLSKEA
jgi:hypothetical protein